MHKIDCLIKVGGSLIGKNESFSALINTLEYISETKRIVLTTGSKDISDIVRDRLKDILDIQLSLKNHIDITWKTRDIMSQTFCDISQKFIPIFSMSDINWVLDSGNIPVIIQYELLKQLQPFPLVRGLSTDTSSAFFANELNVDRFIKLTDVDGVFTNLDNKDSLVKEIDTGSLKKIGRTCICTALADFLERINSVCYVMNGNKSDNLKSFVERGEGIFTKVTPN